MLPVYPAPPVRPEDMPPERPGALTAAVVLSVVGSVIWLGNGGGVYPGGTITCLGVLHVCYVVMVVAAIRGLNAARITATVLIGLLSLIYLPLTVLGFVITTSPRYYGPISAILNIAALLCACLVAMLFYRPRSNEYFRRTAARRPYR